MFFPSPRSTAASVATSASPAPFPTSAGGCDDGVHEAASDLATGAGTVVLEAAHRSTAAAVRAWQATPLHHDGAAPVPRPSPQPWLADLEDGATVHVCTYGAPNFGAPGNAGNDPYTHVTFLVAEGEPPHPYRAWGGDGAPGPPAPEDAEPLLP